MNAKRTVLQVPKPAPVRGSNGKYEPGKGDKLLEAHRKQQNAAKPKG